MGNDLPVVKGDFHVIRMDGMFHVVFRPDADPEWFRIVASFYTYDRAWSYCDIERVSSYEPDSWTGEEEVGGYRQPPVGEFPESPLEARDGIAEMTRTVYDGGEHVDPHPTEDFTDHPQEDEHPTAYHERIFAEAICKAADAPEPEPSASLPPLDPATEVLLTDKQRRVLNYLRGRSNSAHLVNASHRDIANACGVSPGSMVYLTETLERKGFIEIVEQGTAVVSGVFRMIQPGEPGVIRGPVCSDCGKPRSPSSGSRCLACYRAGVPA